MIDRFIDHRVDFVLGDVTDFFGPPVQKRLELLNHSGFVPGVLNALVRHNNSDRTRFR